LRRLLAMCITGHETDAMFRGYNITSEADLRDAMQKVTKYNKAERHSFPSRNESPHSSLHQHFEKKKGLHWSEQPFAFQLLELVAGVRFELTTFGL
jgi:hypothetical protein